MSLKQEIMEELENRKSFNAEALVDIAQKASAKEDEIPEDEDILNKESKKHGDTGKAVSEINDGMGSMGAGPGFGMMPLDDVEVSDEDKDKFLACISSPSDCAFTRGFSLYGGRVTGVFKSRSTNESRAIINEINRIWTGERLTLPFDYSCLLRMSMLRFQLMELNGVLYEPPKDPINAVMAVDPSTKSKVIKSPEWMDTLDVAIGKMNEGLLQSLYEELLVFERIYWTMVKNSKNQNFWNPEGSTIG